MEDGGWALELLDKVGRAGEGEGASGVMGEKIELEGWGMEVVEEFLDETGGADGRWRLAGGKLSWDCEVGGAGRRR